MATVQERRDQIIQLLNDPIADLDFKETSSLVYHYIRYEILEVRIILLDRRQQKHGQKIQDALNVANFKHELQDL